MSAPRFARLAALEVAGSTAPTRHLVMLHGIYGRGRNWQAVARRIVAERSEYTCWLVDLRHHGDSANAGASDTLDGLAGDVARWMADTGISADATLGHSYGGKVALALAGQLAETPLQTWIIDSTPEAKDAGGSAWDMLAAVRRLPSVFATRAEAVEALAAQGVSTAVAQWMSTNLDRHNDHFTWRLDFDAMERLLRDFFATDLWPVLETPAPAHVFHLVKASESSVLSPGAVARLEALGGSGAPVHLHHLQGGHWVHAESPDAVATLVAAHLP